jgi:hypothetical protein
MAMPAVAKRVGAPTDAAATAPPRGPLTAILVLTALFMVFLAGIPYLGFDLAVFFSVIAGLWLLGERRVLFSLALALAVAAALCLGGAAVGALGVNAIG